ncbi:MAG: hypothetical protein CML06_14475 [Pseudomonadales bacterium]|nr:hypothetical protein [Pseudomonadales bacterium]
MTGGYRANFEFVETFGYQPGFSPAAPYQSWGTEYIYVLEEKADFISLQHIMVMFFETEDGNIQGPMVMKHWRQDWQFEPRQLLEYQGQQTWRLRPLDAQERRGRWGQTVYQVDDSPRYASLGQWQHEPGYSQWESGRTWRPLPRRESSVRDDYQVLEGINRHIILPDGWVQEEANRKLRLAPDGKPQAYVARELGNNRYQRVRDFDFRAGDRYLRETADFWKQVRVEWSRLIKRHRGLHLRQEVDGVALFSALFELAERYRQESKDATAAQQEIQQILQRYSSKPA